MEGQTSLGGLTVEDTDDEENLLTPMGDEELAYWQEVFFNEYIEEEKLAAS